MSKALDLPTITQDPDRLNRLSLAELRALWGLCCPKIPPSSHRAILVRDLAFVAQSDETRLPKETDALIRAAMKVASVTRSPDEGHRRDKPRMPMPKATQDLPAGAVLMREWGGGTHKVTVLGGGWFQYQGHSYKSLSKVAFVITGAHWSGPCFFGMHLARKKA